MERRSIIESACKDCGYDGTKIGVAFTNRYVNVIARAYIQYPADYRRCVSKVIADEIERDNGPEDLVTYIIINAKLWSLLRKKMRREILVHETCHVLDYVTQIEAALPVALRPRDIIKEHGEQWAAFMRMCDCEPMATYPVEPEYCNNWVGMCKCNYHILPPSKINLLKNGRLDRYCAVCAEKLEPYQLPSADLNEIAA